uniref:acyl-CoA dehydrogenase family protein n=2 Tax=Pseudomonadota TaxID=1224 RepID=UPI002157C0EC
EVARRHADAVDQEARFPHEAFAALRAAGLLGAMVPQAQGGAGASLATVAALCRELGQGCASTGMIYAMHQIQVACLVDHGAASDWHQALLARVAAE